MNQYAVWGNPIEHSLSPRIHQLFAEQTNKKISYTAISTNKEEFKAQIFNFLKKQGTKGANVTAPFKELAMEVAEEHSVPCLIAGSCNTLAILDKGVLVADNTDGIGLVTDLTRLDWLQPNQKILILGAGGATKGVLYPLLTAKQNITIYNRTSEKAVTLSQKFAKYGEINSTTFDELNNQSFDLIINATSAGLTGKHINIPKTLFKKTNIYDMQYASNMNTPFLNYAKQNGASCCQDGLGMLVAQAAYSFYKWEKVMPQIEPVLKQLRTEIK
ncbi:shikimate dehydrogenase [Pasteurella atlantica]|uniref:Shikimate dehydrogenase n=2 Tax=Pasteurellaceae TaxID=712 RepID=A0ACC6HJT1_9PAST|nr:shikimate dehydrogenase [Pasteurella atlantica]MDP8051130.1 shikimate dehydrogenase [Pasteurella atlantica]MDP8104426.1 shikimate dehydrogenase [Pasteurella atlantica]MDP8147786.1 shikimate dehydrogenase [Pasteurella atlantica]